MAVDMGQAQRTCNRCGAPIPQQHKKGECPEPEDGGKHL